MKKLFKGAVPTIALLLVAIISLSSVTYAWFTAGSEATVDTITVKVEDVNGLLVSANGYNGTWGSALTPSIANSAAKLTNVSTTGALFASTEVGNGNAYPNMSEGNIKFYSVEYNNAYDAFTEAKLLTTAYGQSTTGYYKFTMYVKNESTGTLTVSLDGSTVGSNLSSLGARLAVVNMGTASATAALNNQTSPVVSGTPALIGIWEPSATTHTSDGEAWLLTNGQTKTGPKSYMAVNAEITKAANDSLEAYTNVATGEVFTINGAELTLEAIDATTNPTYDSNDVPKYLVGSTNTDYYVYTALTSGTDGSANHFRPLRISDFFKVASIDAMIASQTAITPLATALQTATNAKTTATTDAITALGLANEAALVAIDNTTAPQNPGAALTQPTEPSISDSTDPGYDQDAWDTYYNELSAYNDYVTAKTKYDAYTAYTTAVSNYNTAKTAYDAKVASENWDYYTEASSVYTPVAPTAALDYGTTYYTKATVGYKTSGSPSTTNIAEVKAYKKTANASLAKIDASTNGDATAKNTNGTNVDAFNDASKLQFTVAASTIEKIDVYIWLEGQDCDTTNYVAGINFTVDLKFKKVTQ